MPCVNRPKKRGPYHRYNPQVRAEIGKYACINGVAAASRMFTRKMGHQVSTATVMSIKKAYLEEKKRQERETGQYTQVMQLPCKPRGRPLLLVFWIAKFSYCLTK